MLIIPWSIEHRDGVLLSPHDKSVNKARAAYQS